MVTLVSLPHGIALCPRNCYFGRSWTKCSKAKVSGLPPEISDPTEEVVIEWDNITELTEELFDSTGLWRLHTLVFGHTQIMKTRKNHINFEFFLVTCRIETGTLAERDQNGTQTVELDSLRELAK
jgi:hypothetical protein